MGVPARGRAASPLEPLTCRAQVFYFVWGNCLVSFGFLMSTIFTNLKTAVVVGGPHPTPCTMPALIGHRPAEDVGEMSHPHDCAVLELA